MKKLFVLFLVLILISCSNQNFINERNKVSVIGQSEVLAKPDQVEMYVNIITEGKTSEEVKDKNNELSKEVINSLKKEAKVETANYYLNPKYDYSLRTMKIIGYTLTNTLKITSKNIDDAGKLIDLAIENGANGVSGLSFTLSEEAKNKVNREALELASKEAKNKAEAIASALDLRLGKVIEINEANYDYRPYVSYDYGDMKAEGMVATTSVEPQSVKLSTRINVVFSIY